MNFEITDVSDTPVRGVSQFMYEGYIVSMSTIFKMKDPVAVFLGDDDQGNFETVQDALDYIVSEVYPDAFSLMMEG